MSQATVGNPANWTRFRLDCTTCGWEETGPLHLVTAVFEMHQWGNHLMGDDHRWGKFQRVVEEKTKDASPDYQD